MVQSTSAVRQAIEETDRRFESAFRSGDMASLAALYSEDAVLLPPNSQMIKGKQAIEAFWSGARQMGVREAALRTVEVGHEGDVAHEIGTYRLNIQTEGGPAATDDGKYVVVWKRQADGSWKLAVDIWNTSLPPAP